MNDSPTPKPWIQDIREVERFERAMLDPDLREELERRRSEQASVDSFLQVQICRHLVAIRSLLASPSQQGQADAGDRHDK